MGVKAVTRVPAGMIAPFAGGTAPAGWLDCFGQDVSRTTYAALFAAIATTYGAGDGLTTFNVPDFRGRNIVGAGTGAGLTNRTRGSTGGAETHPLTANENGQHAHGTFSNSNTSAAGSVSGSGNGTFSVDGGNSGTGAAHNNMSPWGCAAYIIKF